MKKQNNYGIVYCIINIVNNKKYVGSSINFKKRKYDHLRDLKNNKHSNILLQNAYNKYNKESFVFEILCHEPKETLLNRENELFKILKPEYNISKDASAPMTGRKHSPKTLELFKYRKTCKGCKKPEWTEEHKINHRNSMIGLKRSEEFKEKRRLESISDNRQKYLDKSRELAKRKVKDSLDNIFNSMVECAEFHDISVQTVCDILKGRHHKTRKGVSFTYA